MAKESQTTAVQVALRIRPLTERDRAQPRFANIAADDILKVHEKTVHVVPHNKLFTFDHVFGPNSRQSQIFAALGEKLVHKFVEGYNVTLLAYGQTSSGKTYTMGTAQHQPGRYNEEEEGIVPRAMALLFETLQQQSSSDRPVTPAPSASSSTDTTSTRNRLRPPSRIATHASTHQHQQPSLSTSSSSSALKPKYTVKVSFVEIYNEELNDLLNGAPAHERPPIYIREDAKGHIYWTGVKEVTVHSTEDVLYYLEQGTRNRATGATDMNEKSSRSHAIFSVSLKHEKWVPNGNNRSESPIPGSRKTKPQSSLGARAGHEEGEVVITSSKFHFVDLAGSERLKRTAAEGDRRKEGININAGLLALGNVISALGDPSKRTTHVPYRDSKLTRLLQDSLGGSAATLMIACVSPAEYNLSETLNTLQYANRARNIKNRIEKNEVEEWMTTDNIEMLRSMVSKLKIELRNARTGSTSTTSTVVNSRDDPDIIGKMHEQQNGDYDQLFQEQRMIIADLQRQIEELDGEASVTRERNRVVEAELKRMRKLESMRKQENENMDFQHLVEPVIEEYEKSISALESKLAMTRAALTHADAGIEEQRVKLEQYEAMLENQEHTMTELRARLSKMIEREQSNEAYIDELEGKLMRSSNEALRSQELLNELRSRISKFKETDESTEQYIFDLERRLATSEADKATLQQTVDDLESKHADKDATIEKLQDQLSQAENVNTQKLMLQELDTMTVKYNMVEKERDRLLKQVELLTQQQEQQRQQQQERDAHKSSQNSTGQGAQTNARPEFSTDNDEIATSRQRYRRSYAEEKETPASIAARAAEQAEQRAKEESDRASRLQQQLRELEKDHQGTLKELDEVLMRYQEALEQLDLLQKPDNLLDDKETKVPDLSQEMSRAKEEAINKERQANLEKIKHLEQHVNDLSGQLGQYLEQLESASKEAQQRVQDFEDRLTVVAQEKGAQQEHIQRLERELQTAQDRIRILQEVADQHTAAEEIEKTLRELEIKDKAKSQEYQEEIRLVRAENATLQQKYDKLETDYNQLLADQEKGDGLKKQLDTSVTEKSQLEKQLQQMEVVNVELEDKVRELQQIEKRKTEALAELEKRLLSLDDALKQEKEAAQIQLASLEEENSRLEKDVANLRSSLEELREALGTKENDVAKLLEKIDDSDKKCEQISKELQHLQTINASLESTLKASSTDGELRNQDLEKHIQKIATLETEIQQKTASLAKSTEEMDQYRSSVQEHIKQLEWQIDLHSGETENRSKELEQTRSKLAEFEDQCKQQQEIIEKLQNELKTSKESHNSVSAEFQEKQGKLDKVVQELTQSKAQLERLNQATKQKEQQLELQQQELEVLQDELESVLEEKRIADKENAETISALEAAMKENDELGAQLKQTEQALSTARSDVARLEQEIKGLSAEQAIDKVGPLQERLKEMEQLLQKMTQERNMLSDTHLKKTTDLAAAAGALESAKQKIDNLTKQLAEIETSRQEERKQMQRLEQERRQITEELQNSKHQVQELTSTVSLLEKHIQDFEQDLSNANEAVQEKDTHLRSLRSQIETHSRTINELRNELEKSKFAISINEVDTDKEASKLYEDRIAQLERRSKQLEDENLEYVTLSEEMENEVNRLMKELDDRTRSNDRETEEYLDTIQRMEKQIEELTEDRDNREKEKDRISAALQELQAEYAKITRELQATMENTRAAETTSRELQNTIEELQKENTELRRTLGEPTEPNQQDQDVKAALEAAESKLKSQQSSINQIQSKLKSTESALQDSKKQLEESMQAREKAEKRSTELKERLGKLEQDVAQEKRSLETQVAIQKKEKEKAEQALAALERQVEEMLSKKSKFMCF